MKRILLSGAFAACAAFATAVLLSCDNYEEESATAFATNENLNGDAKTKRVASIDEYNFFYDDANRLTSVKSSNANITYKINYNPFSIEKTKLSSESYDIKLFNFSFSPEGYVTSYCVEGNAVYDEDNFAYNYTEKRDITYDINGRITQVSYNEYYCDKEILTGEIDTYKTIGTRIVTWKNGDLVKVKKDETCVVEKTQNDGSSRTHKRFNTWTKNCQTSNDINHNGQNTIESGTIINVGECDGLLSVLGMLGKGSLHFVTKCSEEYAEGRIGGETYSGSYTYNYTYETNEDGYVAYDSYNGRYAYE